MKDNKRVQTNTSYVVRPAGECPQHRGISWGSIRNQTSKKYMSKCQWLRKYAHLRLHTELVRIGGIKQWCNSVCSFGSPSLQCVGGSADVLITKEATAGRMKLKLYLFPQLEWYFIPSKVDKR